VGDGAAAAVAAAALFLEFLRWDEFFSHDDKAGVNFP
jgi:hypothetical protein